MKAKLAQMSHVMSDLAVSCRLSTTLMISSKFRPVVAGYSRLSFSVLSGPMTNTALIRYGVIR